LREGHGKELIPTGEVTNAVVALVAIDATAELLAVNPIHDLTENWLFGAHFRILALSMLGKNAKRRRNQSHPSRRANPSISNLFISQQFDKPDDSGITILCGLLFSLVVQTLRGDFP
jgi:hypothetical protein